VGGVCSDEELTSILHDHEESTRVLSRSSGKLHLTSFRSRERERESLREREREKEGEDIKKLRERISIQYKRVCV
jgi:hypothetical protein